MNKETIEKIKSLINVFATLVGIVLLSVGAIMVLNPVLKMYVFGIETNSYFDAEGRCLSNLKYELKDIKVNEGKENLVEKTDSEIKSSGEYKTCLVDETEKEKKSYKKQKKENIADGIPFILVGIIILIYYRTKKEKK